MLLSVKTGFVTSLRYRQSTRQKKVYEACSMQRVHTFKDVSACLSVHSVQREYSGGRRRGGWKFLMYPSETTTTHQHSSHFIFLFIGIRCSDRRQAIRDSCETQLPLAAWATVLPFVVCRLHVVQGLHPKASTLFVWCRR